MSVFNATYFTYDGTSSQTYGLQIVDVDDSVVKETDVFSPTLSLQKVPGSLRFFHGGIEYDSAPSCEFSVMSADELTIATRRTILSWLVGRKAFKALTFTGGDYGTSANLTYYCVFTSAKTIWVNGRCHGLRLTAQFDSLYARGASREYEVTTRTLTITNNSDVVDGYVYPVITFNGDIDIVNTTDDENRHFTFSGNSATNLIVVDNETRHIYSTSGGSKLSNFTSKNWLRLRKGTNTLRVTHTGAYCSIYVPNYVMIGC